MRGLTLERVAELTKLSPRILSQIESGDFSALPAGLQGRAHVRAYARAVGVDPEEIVAALGERVPVEPDPLEALRQRERRRFATDHPLTASLNDGVASFRRRAEAVGRRVRSMRGAGSLLRRHASGALIDAAILAGVTAVMLTLTTWLTNSGVDVLWRAARWPFAVSWALTVVLYFSVSQILGGRSIGTTAAGWLARALEHRHAQSAARGHAS